MKFFATSVPILLLFAVILTNGEIEQLSTTDKPSENEGVDVGPSPDKAPTDGLVVEVAAIGFAITNISPCEEICATSTLNCTEWNDCAIKHSDICLGFQTDCSSDDDFITTADNADDSKCKCTHTFHVVDFLWIMLFGTLFYVSTQHYVRLISELTNIRKKMKGQKTANCVQNYEQTQEQQKDKVVIPVESDSAPIAITV
ncbi:unnamed protein product [Orchesella dallaii]|uniref:Uncharacterized protein n=1 Tax=Orchesella dallaii TaxID=48710 RepID=A0ABP1S3P6_9HEXA